MAGRRSITEKIEEWLLFKNGMIGHGWTQMNTDRKKHYFAYGEEKLFTNRLYPIQGRFTAARRL